jgi:hypothetical protein
MLQYLVNVQFKHKNTTAFYEADIRISQHTREAHFGYTDCTLYTYYISRDLVSDQLIAEKST